MEAKETPPKSKLSYLKLSFPKDSRPFKGNFNSKLEDQNNQDFFKLSKNQMSYLKKVSNTNHIPLETIRNEMPNFYSKIMNNLKTLLETNNLSQYLRFFEDIRRKNNCFVLYGSSSDFTPSTKDELYSKSRNICSRCFCDVISYRKGEIAHIYDASPNGIYRPSNKPPSFLRSIKNLILLCSNCHKWADTIYDPPSSEVLFALKKRIESYNELKNTATIYTLVKILHDDLKNALFMFTEQKILPPKFIFEILNWKIVEFVSSKPLQVQTVNPVSNKNFPLEGKLSPEKTKPQKHPFIKQLLKHFKPQFGQVPTDYLIVDAFFNHCYQFYSSKSNLIPQASPQKFFVEFRDSPVIKNIFKLCKTMYSFPPDLEVKHLLDTSFEIESLNVSNPFPDTIGLVAFITAVETILSSPNIPEDFCVKVAKILKDHFFQETSLSSIQNKKDLESFLKQIKSELNGNKSKPTDENYYLHAFNKQQREWEILKEKQPRVIRYVLEKRPPNSKDHGSPGYSNFPGLEINKSDFKNCPAATKSKTYINSILRLFRLSPYITRNQWINFSTNKLIKYDIQNKSVLYREFRSFLKDPASIDNVKLKEYIQKSSSSTLSTLSTSSTSTQLKTEKLLKRFILYYKGPHNSLIEEFDSTKFTKKILDSFFNSQLKVENPKLFCETIKFLRAKENQVINSLVKNTQNSFAQVFRYLSKESIEISNLDSLEPLQKSILVENREYKQDRYFRKFQPKELGNFAKLEKFYNVANPLSDEQKLKYKGEILEFYQENNIKDWWETLFSKFPAEWYFEKSFCFPRSNYPRDFDEKFVSFYLKSILSAVKHWKEYTNFTPHFQTYFSGLLDRFLYYPEYFLDFWFTR